MTSSSTDRIEKSIMIQAPRARVWRALANAEEFGKWFGANLQGQAFVPGHRTQGQITIAGFEHVVFEALVERIEPESLFSFRWHPYAVDPGTDYSKEPATLVVFELKDAGSATLLSVVESGFDKLPVSRRDLAFRMNSGGWEGQMRNIDKYASSN